MNKFLVLLLVALSWAQAKSQSSGWIPYKLTTGQIFRPVTVNGHQVNARLVNYGKTRVDRDLVTSIGLDTTKTFHIQFGKLALPQGLVVTLYQHPPNTPPFDIFLGNEPFQQWIVDIDFPNKRIAFYNPDGFTPPAGAIALTFNQYAESHAVPLRVEGGPEKSYWVFLGEPAPISIYSSYFTPRGKLQDRPSSLRMGGGQKTPPEAIATVKEVRLSDRDFTQIPGVFPDDSVTGEHPEEIAGHIGVGFCAQARVIFDYVHNRFYLVPGKPTNKALPKDYTGLVLVKAQDDYVVKFVSPHSPAMKAGFKPGDTVIQINHQPVLAFQGIAWQAPAWRTVLDSKKGVTYTFTLKDGNILKLTTDEFF